MTDLAALAAAVQAARRNLDRQAGRAQQVAKAGKAAEADIARLQERTELYAKVAALLTSIGEERQESARSMFEDLTTRALRDIFGEDDLSFRLAPGESGGQVTLEPVIASQQDGELLETSVLDARGGGMAVVAGFVLQLVMVLLTPAVRKVMFLDEPFVFVSESFRAQLAAFIRDEVAKRVQVIMITHDGIYAEYADARVRFALGPDGVTQVFKGESE